MKTWIDPSPSGWQYGFPKLHDDEVDGKYTTKWLVDNGYPPRLAKECIIRCWQAEDTGDSL